ncbi:MAG: IS110 family transposase [Peptococcaceae bacterium]|nr:IS110 family transposase [Peptococcaceae bacterium]
MKVVYPICCGVDVHKAFFVATIITTTDGIMPHYQKKRFSTFNKQILAFKKWLLENNCRDVCMESTGKYYIPVLNLLEDSINVTVANPKWVRAVKGYKDDEKDSKWIGNLFRIGLVPGSFMPSKPFRILREYTRYLFKMVNAKSSEKNRYQNVFTVCNVALDAVVSDMFGVSASNITDYITNSDTFDPDYCVSLLRGTLKNKAESVVESIEGFQMTEAQKARARLIRDHYDFLVNHISILESSIEALAAPYKAAIQLLCTIPGIKERSAISILAEIGDDMSQFGSAKRLCSWGGLTPSNNQSAGKKKSVRITRAGVYLKPALVEVAHAAVKDLKNPYYGIKYERIKRRRGKKRGIIAIAIARMILTAIYHMLSTGEVWNPCDLPQIDMTPEFQEKQLKRDIRRAAKLLVANGIINLSDIKFSDTA